jgi:Fe-Mn family superoxide dismutase
MTIEIDRRTAMGVIATAGGVLAATACASAQQAGSASAGSVAAYQPKALPFDAGAVAGLSEKLITSHHANNYAGAVRRLGAIETELAALDPASTPGFRLNGLKREELMALNSMILHEVYFDNLAGSASAPSGGLGGRIEQDFGSFDRWRAEFIAMGKALGGGSGWVLLTWSPRRGRLFNAWAADHTLTAADGDILLALDMYEHAYAMDYGANAGAYVDAFMAAMKWDSAIATYDAAAAPT